LCAPGVTFFGAALPKAGLTSFDRSAVAGPAPAVACVALDWVARVFLAAGFLLLVAIWRLLIVLSGNSGRKEVAHPLGIAPSPDNSTQSHNGVKTLKFPSENIEN
jgi:hypothetical protein